MACCQSIIIQGDGLAGRGSGIYHRKMEYFDTRVQYQHESNPKYFIFYNKNEFAVGEKNTLRLFLRAMGSKKNHCPFSSEGYKIRQQRSTDWKKSFSVSVKCYTKPRTTSITTTTTITTTYQPHLFIPQNEESEIEKIMIEEKIFGGEEIVDVQICIK
jgi:hypothetical protein